MIEPRYTQTPDSISTYKIENQTFVVNSFFNQEATEKMDNTMLRVIVSEQTRK